MCARSISTVDVQDSLFHQCRCEGKNESELGGGGILIRNVNSPSVSASAFIDNYCGRDGAGISLDNSNAPVQQVILNCRFIKCISNGVSADGGGVHIWDNERNLGFSNCVFSLCESNADGGALFHHLILAETEPSICFCFFHQNKGSSGNDINIYPSGSSKTILHCFSTSTGIPRIYPSCHDNAWLPQGSIYFVNSTTEEAIGTDR